MENEIFSIGTEEEFNEIALKVFRLQFETNEVYRKYCQLREIQIHQIDHFTKIPFLPIQFFKSENVQSGKFEAEITFLSSGTGGDRSSHLVKKKGLYEQSFLNSFKRIYQEPSDYTILALLPSYLEQGDSSLVYMCDKLIKYSKNEESGFFLHDHLALSKQLNLLKDRSHKTLLIGVSYALLDFVESYPNMGFPELVVMETGGMKGRKKELIREELHGTLKKGFNVQQIHSEYGMTELMSQAYATDKGRFSSPPWMKVMIRKQEDPFNYLNEKEVGGINIIDLANLYSCSFIQTDDLGKKVGDRFEVLGRFDNAEIRGCSQLAI